VEVAFILRTKLDSCSAGKDREISVFEKQHMWMKKAKMNYSYFS